MKTINEKLNILRHELKNRKARIMIIGLGSVGNYLMDYLMSSKDENIEIAVVGRNKEKLESDANIVRVASLIRGQNRSRITVISDVDLNDVASIEKAIAEFSPDIIVNSSRAYAGLKYGSISWKNVRAYGIWSPLSIRFTKNIMEAYENVNSDAIVINTSYSDAVIPWLKSAGKAYPDFGSGNINHLIYRFKLAAGQLLDIEDYWNIDITFAVAHFHDVVISKEGHTEGTEMLIDIRYNGEPVSVGIDEIIAHCGIPMPVDAKRNMMNASSNYEIIKAILDAVRDHKKIKLHCPGVFGEIGGYPVIIDGENEDMKAYIDESVFTLEQMRRKNRESIYLDGIENVSDGVLTYTDELLEKVRKAFGVELVKNVPFANIDETADFIVKEIIEKNK
ncbi:MAG: saccharopine dehydrogenase NADP-binding domain-containing protein [Eubacteriales bacterium]|nr:saccharopine dehydrogenase NADP-binding domain-containing protein [Eubacteriales bacterium]